MQPAFSNSKEDLNPLTVFAEIKEWESILAKNRDVLIKNQIL